MLTRVLAEIEGDTMLELDLSGFEVVERIDVPVSERDEYSTEFLELVRVAAADSAGGPTKN
jgi:dihydrofolate reductase